MDRYWKEQLGDLYEHFYTDVQLGASIGLGWIELYVNAAKKIKAVLDANPEFRCKIVQVKEKFGGLRLYTQMFSEGMADDPDGDLLLDPRHNDLTGLIEAIITEAEEVASRTCETCGAPGCQVSATGWIHVACSKHSRL